MFFVILRSVATKDLERVSYSKMYGVGAASKPIFGSQPAGTGFFAGIMDTEAAVYAD